MALLSNLFGGFGGNGGNDSNTSANASDFTSDIDAVIDLNFSSDSYESYTDGDESYETMDSNDFGLGLDVGSLINSVTDSFSDSDSTSFG